MDFFFFFPGLVSLPLLTSPMSHRLSGLRTQICTGIRSVGVFVFYSRAKVTALSPQDGSTCTAAQRPLDVLEVLSPFRLCGINHSPRSPEPRRLFFSNPFPLPRRCHCQICRPRLKKLFLDCEVNRKRFFFYCTADVTEQKSLE